MVAFRLPGGLDIYAFSILIGLGAALGLAWAVSKVPKNRALVLVNAGLWSLVGGVLGGRAAFVAAHWSYFQIQPWESWQVFLGGLSWPGTLAGGVLVLALYASFTRQSLGFLADGLLPLLATLTISAWLGCWLDGCAYGPPVHAWWAVPAQDEFGQLALRWPVQLFGALLALGLFWLLDQDGFPDPGLRARPGQLFSLAILGLSLQLLATGLLRADPAPQWAGLRLDAWAALGFVAISALTILVTHLQGIRD